MSTAPNTAVWMKELSFEDASETLQLRENAAKVMADNLTTEQIEDLVRLAFGMKPRADCALMTQLIKACQDSDPSFPQFDHDRQLTLIGGMVYATIEQQQRVIKQAHEDIAKLTAERDEYLHRCDALKSLGDMACDQIEIRENSLREAKEAFEAIKPHVQCDPYARLIRAIATINKVLGDE